MKRLTAMLLSMTMLLGLMVPVQAVEEQAEWEKLGFLSEPAALPPVAEAGKLLASVGEPEEGAQPISTVEEFLAAKSGSWYLKNDLDLSSVTGTISLTKTLTIDGQGHKLTGLSVTLYQDYFYGVDLTLKNLLVETADEGVNGSAVLVGSWRGNLQIENCTVSGRLTGGIGSQVGGLATSVPKDGKLVNCAFFGNITAAENGTYVGGLVCSSGADIFNCVFDGTINGGTYVGGITSGSSGAIRSCRAEGSIASAYSAGVVYSGVNGEAVDCIASMDGATCGLVYEGKAVNCVVTDADLKGPGIGGEATGCAVYNSTCVGGGISTSGDVIRDCLVENCTITGTADVGGIANGKSLVSGCAVRNCTITAVGEDGVAGGIVGNADHGIFEGQPGIYDCVVEDTVITGYAVAGGIAGKGFPTLINCSVKGGSVTATGEAAYIGDINSYTGGYAGGILGFIDNSQDCAILSCTADTVVTGYSAGGVAGYFYSNSGTATVQDCHSTGTVTGKYCAGGIVGAFSGTARKCTSEATVKVLLDEREDPADYAVVGGLIGYFSQGLLEESTFNGMVSGTADTNAVVSALGGLVGIQFDSSWSTTTCTVQRCVFQGAIQGTADYMGGILGASGYRSGSQMAFTVLDCEVTQPEGRTTLYISGDKPFEGVGSRIGGIVGSAGGKTGIYRTVINCDLSVSGKPANVGGLAGGFGNNGYVYAEHCTINGDLSVTATGTVDVGGFGCGNISVAGCWINGDVMVSAPEEVIENEGTANESRYVSFVGTITGTRGRSSWYYESGFAADCEMTFNGTVVTEPVAQQQTTYTFKTFDESGRLIDFYIKGGYYDSGETFPLSGAKVTVGTVSGYTDDAGLVQLPLEESAFQSAVTVTVERAGYDTFVDLHAFATNQDYSATLWKLDPGKIFITGGTVRLTEYVTRDIFGAAKTIFPQGDDTVYDLSVNINWNGHKPVEVYLYGEESCHKVPLTVSESGASGSVMFGKEAFASDEMIRLYAKATSEEYGTLYAVKLTSLKIKPIDVEIHMTDPNAQEVSDPKDKNKFFLEGAKVQLDFGDLMDCATSVTLSDGVLNISFKDSAEDKETGDLFTVGDAYSKDTVSVTGTLSVPLMQMLYEPEKAEWAGAISVGLNQDTGFSDNRADAIEDMVNAVENDAPIHEKIHDFTVAGVPVYVKASVGVHAGATLRVYGSMEKTGISGSLNGGASGKVGGGVGGAIGEEWKFDDKPALEVMAGLYGSVTGDFEVKMDFNSQNLDTEFTMKPVVKGEVGGEVIVHLFIVEFEDQLKLGSFTWDDTGIKWDWIGKKPEEEDGELATLSLEVEEDQWQLIGREYLNRVDLLAEDDPNLLQANVNPSVETATASNLAYATLEDTSVENQRNAMRLYVWQKGKPEGTLIEADNTSDHSPHADGEYVVWVDVAEQSDSDGLASFLEDGRIAVEAGTYNYSWGRYYFNGEKILLTEPKSGVRTYHPVVTSFWNDETRKTDARVVWLESPIYDSDDKLTLMPEITEIWYSTSAGGAEWSEPVKLTTVEGAVSEIYHADGGSSISYRVGTTLYTVPIDGGEAEMQWNDRSLYNVCGYYAVWVQDGAFYKQYLDRTPTRQMELNSMPTQTPVCDSNYIYYAVDNQLWCASSTDLYLVAEAEGTIRELRHDGQRLIYAVDTDNGTDLYYYKPTAYQDTILSIGQRGNDLVVKYRTSNFWQILDGETVLLDRDADEGVESAYEGGITTLVIDASLLPTGKTLTFAAYHSKCDFFVNEPEVLVSIEDAQIKDDLLAVTLQTQGSAVPQFTLSDWESGETVAEWSGEEATISGLNWCGTRDVSALPDGYYLLTASCGDSKAVVVVSKGDPLAEEDTVEVGTPVTGDGETTIRLMDSGKQLSGQVLVLAARYEKGQMKESTFGTAEGGEGIWDLILPEQVTEGWKLFLLDSTTKAPLCEPIVVQ